MINPKFDNLVITFFKVLEFLKNHFQKVFRILKPLIEARETILGNSRTLKYYISDRGKPFLS
jgi:hypothetical protein